MTARVLVVDDVLHNVKLLEAKLRSQYFDVLTAMDGVEALEIIENEQPDIVLLDVMMPGMDGFEVCRRVKGNPKVAHIPIIMVTALDQPKDRVTGLEAGADDFLTKPIQDLPLFARVKSLVRLKVLMDELRIRNSTGQAFSGDTLSELSSAIDMNNVKALLIEDYERVAKRIVGYLDETVDQVDLDNVADGKISTEKLEQYDLFIISLSLRDVDGLRLCSQIRSSENTRHSPILVLIDDGDNDTLIQAMEIGVTDYATRPIDGNELVARVKSQVRHKRFADYLRGKMKKNMEMAVTDAVTNLYNRHFLDTHLDNIFKKGPDSRPKTSLLMLDIDHFKKVNDTYGHASGDEVLEEFSKRISDNMRSIDLVARYGGEEFVVVMPETDADFAMFIAERVRKKISEEPFKISGSEEPINVTVSIGVSIVSDDCNTKEELLKQADEGLYKAKENGRNMVCGSTCLIDQ
ncbi:PleD family two-component system response regulator [Pseudemcibacter aquimaris]|uniref:PleD family two-component system response regulator n=1 Tax=Pseudemcibacter aquimaris TaxID=2857064 RepID=UPI0020139C11|nr:PleD family two-component system response regulator [Pseudemcibacter aquimaris]MCC3860489.1 PleD family two-component system response regulator [Pseudemcibacter aquimaris]WDU59314.1 PleD family two-component system response regulator [Pseudemcibacter aquimaris]